MPFERPELPIEAHFHDGPYNGRVIRIWQKLAIGDEYGISGTDGAGTYRLRAVNPDGSYDLVYDAEAPVNAPPLIRDDRGPEIPAGADRSLAGEAVTTHAYRRGLLSPATKAVLDRCEAFWEDAPGGGRECRDGTLDLRSLGFAFEDATYEEVCAVVTAMLRLLGSTAGSIAGTSGLDETIRWSATVLRLGGAVVHVQIEEHVRQLLAAAVHASLSRTMPRFEVPVGEDPHAAGFLLNAYDSARFLAFPALEALLRQMTSTVDAAGVYSGPKRTVGNRKLGHRRPGTPDQINNLETLLLLHADDGSDDDLRHDLSLCFAALRRTARSPEAEIAGWRNASFHGSEMPGFLGTYITLLALRVALATVRSTYAGCVAAAWPLIAQSSSSRLQGRLLATTFWPPLTWTDAQVQTAGASALRAMS